MQADSALRKDDWLDDASEPCPHCLQLYVFELEYRCSDCDIEICPFCVADHRSEARCPECPPTTGERAANGDAEDEDDDDEGEADDYKAFAVEFEEEEE